MALCFQGYPGLDGRKGESGAAGAKVRPVRNPEPTFKRVLQMYSAAPACVPSRVRLVPVELLEVLDRL